MDSWFHGFREWDHGGTPAGIESAIQFSLAPCNYRIILRMMKHKRTCERAVCTGISMPPELWKIATEEQRRQNYSTFSDLMQSLIRKIHGGPAANV